MELPNGVTLDVDIDDLFKDDIETGTPPVVTPERKVELTEAMTKRINEVRASAEATVRDSMAKELGYENYNDLLKAKDKKLITEAGYDPEELEKIIEPLLQKRFDSDPRMQKLQQLEVTEQKNIMDAQLAEIEKLTGLKVKETDLSKETLDLMGKGVPLAQAYIAANSAKIISGNYKGTTNHMASGSGTGQVKTRGLSQSEKDLYKSINPTATDEEVNKKTIEV